MKPLAKDTVGKREWLILTENDREIDGLQQSAWLPFAGRVEDSLWPVDFFRYEYATLRSQWVLVVIDPWTRRTIGVGVHTGDVDGVRVVDD